MKYEANGKEILCNGSHFGDATNVEDAALIVKALTMMEATPDTINHAMVCICKPFKHNRHHHKAGCPYNVMEPRAAPCAICGGVNGHVAPCVLLLP